MEDPHRHQPDLPPSRRDLTDLINRQDAAGAQAFFSRLDAGDTARAILDLPRDAQARLLLLLRPEAAANVMRDVEDAHAADVIQELPAPAAAAIMDELPSDERADLLGQMDRDAADAILQEMPAADAAEATRLLTYPSDSAGGLMITEFLAFREDQTVGHVVRDLHINRDRYSEVDVQYIYVLNKDGRLAGVMRLRDLIFSDPDRLLGQSMIPGPVSVRADVNLGELREHFEVHRLRGLPVVDEQRRLIGIVEPEAVEDALNRQSSRQFLRISGILSGDEFRTMPLRVRSGRRLAWLTLNIVLNLISASVIAIYQSTLQAAVALAIFLPIISDMSGCSGNQAVAVSIRELSLGLIRPREYLRVLRKEASLGVLVGAMLGILLAVVAWLWKGNLALSLVVGIALSVNTLVSVSLGGMLPLLLRRLRIDPALLASPILTTVTDTCGFFLVLSLATLVLRRVAGG